MLDDRNNRVYLLKKQASSIIEFEDGYKTLGKY